MGTKPTVKPVPAPKGPVKEPDYYMRDTSTRGGRYVMPSAKFQRGYKDTMYREDKRDEQGRVTSMERSHVPKEWLKPVYKPLEFNPRKHAVKATSTMKKSITELRYGAQPLHGFDLHKSCAVCGRLSKSAGEKGHEGHSGCCEDCKKSMNSMRWHESHLA